MTDIYLRFPLIREWVKGLRRGQLQAVQNTLRRSGLNPNSDKLDYSQSLIIPTGFGLQMWINSKDTFPQGIISEEEKGPTCEALCKFLKADRDPVNGRPIISEVYRGDQVYKGEFAKQGPDLVIEYTNFYHSEQTGNGENPHLEGGHTLEGIFLADGPGIRSGQISGATLMDLAPTILHVFGQAIPPDMDGKVLEGVFRPEYRDEHPIQHGDKPARYDSLDAIPDLTSEEEAEVLDQLRRLGYV